jgi:hypothetical protein
MGCSVRAECPVARFCAGYDTFSRAEGFVAASCVEMVGVGMGVMGDFVYIYGVIF